MGVTDRSIIWEDEPIEVNGIVLYPILMRNYQEWLVCKGALTFRLSSLPALYMAMPYLSAIYATDCEMGFQTGLMSRIFKLLSLSTHMPETDFVPLVDKENPQNLTAIFCKNPERMFRIEAWQFDAIRQAILDLNGEELPDESENIELVEAERDIAEANAQKLDYDVQTMLASVACAYRIRVKDMADWSVREFDQARSAIDRSRQHLLCAISEVSEKTVTFKNGNPVPSWCFDRKKEGSTALEPLSALAQRAGFSANSLQETMPEP